MKKPSIAKIDLVLGRMEADLLKRGEAAWTTGRGYRFRGRRCLTGMIWHHARWNPRLTLAVDAVLAMVVAPYFMKYDNFHPDDILISYNDHGAQSWQDILRLIKRTRAHISGGSFELPIPERESFLSMP